jgi:hypothetical protein
VEGTTVTITVDIRPEVQAELARQAAANGRALETHAATLLEEAAHLPAGELTDAKKRERERGKSLVEVCAMVKGLTDDVDFTRNPSTGRPTDLS